jgi:glycosyltransferase involved in cell wall biosynthesis
MELPRISIVTPSFNQGLFLEECIDSVLSQGYPNLEYIIMDGGSKDNSLEIIKKYEKYLAYWQSEPDGGQYKAINEGFKRTSGEIMAWLNSDDKYHPAVFFKIAYIFSEYKKIEWITGRPTVFDRDSNISLIFDYLPVFSREKYLKEGYDKPHVQQESTFWRRSLWDKAGSMVCADMEFAGDMELWVRFFRHAQLFSVDTVLGGYRYHGNQKAILHPDRYSMEADTVLSTEKELLDKGEYVGMLPAATPIVLDHNELIEYLHNFDGNGSKYIPECIASFGMDRAIKYYSEKLVNLKQDNIGAIIRAEYTANADEEDCDRSIEILKAEIEDLGRRISAQNECLQRIYSSKSWNITKPLRFMGKIFRRACRITK